MLHFLFVLTCWISWHGLLTWLCKTLFIWLSWFLEQTCSAFRRRVSDASGYRETVPNPLFRTLCSAAVNFRAHVLLQLLTESIPQSDHYTCCKLSLVVLCKLIYFVVSLFRFIKSLQRTLAFVIILLFGTELLKSAYWTAALIYFCVSSFSKGCTVWSSRSVSM